MPVIFKDEHICCKCMKKFKWVYFKSQRTKLGDGLPIVESRPSEAMAHQVENAEDSSYKIYVNFPYCGYDNDFILKK